MKIHKLYVRQDKKYVLVAKEGDETAFGPMRLNGLQGLKARLEQQGLKAVLVRQPQSIDELHEVK